MRSFEEILFAVAGRIIRNTDESPEVEDSKKERIRVLIRQGAGQIQNELYDEAILSFSEALEIDRESIGANLSMIKGLRAKGADLEALKWGGFTLALTKEPHARKMVHMLLGGVALDIFRLSRHMPHAEQCLCFYMMALDEDPVDFRPIWNSIEVHIEIAQQSAGDQREAALIDAKNKINLISDQQVTEENIQYMRDILSDGETLRRKVELIGMGDESAFRLASFLQRLEGQIQILSSDKASMGEVNSHNGVDSKYRSKVLAYVLALAIGLGGLLIPTIADASVGTELQQGIITFVDSSQGYSTDTSVFTLEDDIRLSEASPTFDEFEKLALLEPSWDEIVRS